MKTTIIPAAQSALFQLRHERLWKMLTKGGSEPLTLEKMMLVSIRPTKETTGVLLDFWLPLKNHTPVHPLLTSDNVDDLYRLDNFFATFDFIPTYLAEAHNKNVIGNKESLEKLFDFTKTVLQNMLKEEKEEGKDTLLKRSEELFSHLEKKMASYRERLEAKESDNTNFETRHFSPDDLSEENPTALNEVKKALGEEVVQCLATLRETDTPFSRAIFDPELIKAIHTIYEAGGSFKESDTGFSVVFITEE